MRSKKVKTLYEKTKKLYAEAEGLFYHGWPHIDFVISKSIEFSRELNADKFFVETSAILHDTNYLEKKSVSSLSKELRLQLLLECGFNDSESIKIESIINEAQIENRGKSISVEAQALSDADTLFKALPITPILLTYRYLIEIETNIEDLSKEILTRQTPLMEKGIYFYSKMANDNYRKWAVTNLQLWENIESSLQDPVIKKLANKLSPILT